MAFIARRTGTLSLQDDNDGTSESEETLEFIRARFEEMASPHGLWLNDESTDSPLSLAQAVAINELRETEADYLSKLLELKEVYYEPMMASGLISPGQVEDVFQNMAKLITISITILEQCSHSDPISAIVAMSLDQTVVPAFSYYCSHHQAAMVSFRHLERTNKLFAAFMQQPRYEASGKPAQSLDSYLLQPIQRVARYQLILGNVYKNTEVDDPRRTLIAVALESMQDLACQVNQQVAAHQEAQVLAQLAEQFKDVATVDRLCCAKRLCLDVTGIMVRTFTATSKVPSRGGHRRRCLIVQDVEGEPWLLIARRGTALSAGKYTTEVMLAMASWDGVVLADKRAVVLKPKTVEIGKQGYALVVGDAEQLGKLVAALA